MATFSTRAQRQHNPRTQRAHSLTPPAWVAELLSRPEQALMAPETGAAPSVVVHEGAGVTFVSLRVAGARALRRTDFEDAVTNAYRAVFAALSGRAALSPVRFW